MAFISDSIQSLRIEVCGGIASGKTTLANLLTKIGLEPILENFQNNPFWQAFYSDPSKYAFETEITFLLQHYHQIKTNNINNKISICDFSFILDLAYAEIGLTDSKLKSFLTVYEIIKNELSIPKLIIYLKCDAKTELERIRKRCRKEESSIDIHFLNKLNNALEGHISNIQKIQNVVIINSRIKDFAHDELIKDETLSLVSNLLKSFK